MRNKGSSPFLRIDEWSWRSRSSVRVGLCFLLGMVATVLPGPENLSSSIWVANGMLLSYLLLAPRWRWPGYIAAGFAAQCAGGFLVAGLSPAVTIALAALNISEVFLAAYLLRGRAGSLPVFTSRVYLLRFIGFAVIAAPATVGVIFAAIAHQWIGIGFLPALRDWFLTDALGMAVTVPAMVAVFRTRLRNALRSWRDLAPIFLLVAMVPLLFHQTQVPAMSLIFPLLVVIQLRMGLGWASLATLSVAGIGNLVASHMGQPVQIALPIGTVGPALRLQLFVASAMFTLYSISVVVESLRATEKKLREIAYLHDLVTRNSRDVIIIADFKGNRSYVSSSGSNYGRWHPDTLIRLSSLDLVHPDDKPRAAELVRQMRAGLDGALMECRVANAAGEYQWVEASLRTIRDPQTGNPTGILNMVRDIAERKHAELARDFHRSLLKAIHDVSLDGVLVVNPDGKVVSYNRRFAEVWRVSATDIPACLLTPTVEIPDERLLAECVERTKDPAAFLSRVSELYANRDARDHCQIELKDGRTLERYTSALRSAEGHYMGRVWFFRDITERRQAEEELKAAYRAVEELAVIDALTGLANRRRFDECLTTEWRRGMREHEPLSLVLLDVDLFKSYNDTYGHLRGDSCLRQVAESAMDVVTRPGDLVARFGGEEFAMILPNTDHRGALKIADNVREAVAGRCLEHAASPRGVVTVSAGCATIVPHSAQKATDLIEIADCALYRAKRLGRNTTCGSPDQAQIPENRAPACEAAPADCH